MPSCQREVLFQTDAQIVRVACQQSIAQLGWRVISEEQWQFVIKEVTSTFVMFTHPAQITVSIWSRPDGIAAHANGIIFGMGPIQQGHIEGQVGNFINRLTLCVQQANSQQRAVSNTAQSNLAEQLQKLADLHQHGILTDAEYLSAKAKLIL